MNKIPTSEEFLNDQGVPLDKLRNLPWFDYGNILTWLEEYSNLKTKHHVKAALKAAANKAKVVNDPNSYCGNTGSEYPPDQVVDKKSILNAYHENLII